MTDQTGSLTRLRELIGYDAHSRRYQAVPDFLHPWLAKAGAEYASDQLSWDAPRLRWIDDTLPATVKTALEFGSSLGYFSLSLAHNRCMTMTGYEPVKDYAELCNILSALDGMADRARFNPRGVGLQDLADLPAADGIISLNVLHHAGNVFDADLVQEMGGWRAYAVAFLSQLAARYPHLIFQTGNSVKGEAHFPSEDAVPFLAALLAESGWEVKRIGVITNFDDPQYETVLPGDIASVEPVRCRRNPETGLVDYIRGGTTIASLRYGTLQRPLFYCVSKQA